MQPLFLIRSELQPHKFHFGVAGKPFLDRQDGLAFYIDEITAVSLCERQLMRQLVIDHLFRSVQVFHGEFRVTVRLPNDKYLSQHRKTLIESLAYVWNDILVIHKGSGQ